MRIGASVRGVSTTIDRGIPPTIPGQRLGSRTACSILLSMGLVLLGGCSSIGSLDQSQTAKYQGFLHDGKTTKQEVLDRLGSARSSYEDGRILVYYVYLGEDGRVSFTARYGGTCHGCVLVFDAGDVLARHSLVQYGCGERPISHGIGLLKQ